jgi:uridine kinase
MFNSALVYEPAVLKVFAERFLLQVPRSNSAYTEAFRLLKHLSMFVPIFPDEVPQTSILREFIGGSAFKY